MSGNVSLYNETNGISILPTPTIGGVGVMADVTRHATVAFKAEGEAIVLIGETAEEAARPRRLSRDRLRPRGGRPPPVDLAIERRNGDFVRGLIASGKISTCHDLSDGGLAVALALAMAKGIGATVETLPAGPARSLRSSARIRRATSWPFRRPRPRR